MFFQTYSIIDKECVCQSVGCRNAHYKIQNSFHPVCAWVKGASRDRHLRFKARAFSLILLLLPHRTLPLLPPYLAGTTADRLIHDRLSLGHMRSHLAILRSCTAFNELPPFAIVPSFTVAGTQQRTLLMTFDIIVDSFQGHLE